MNARQKQQFNSMLKTLRAIANKYQTPEQLKKRCDKDYWLVYEESLEMEYQSMQVEASSCIKGIKLLS